ncbi:HNH endonuclease signature motif containing protein, partial [Lysobacter korlensis]
GCRFPGCDRPPSWCEAHHLDEWARDGGRTDVADGILLCRHHHMLIHNNAWRIKRDRANYFLIAPRERDPHQTPILMPSKSSALADLQRRKRAG